MGLLALVVWGPGGCASTSNQTQATCVRPSPTVIWDEADHADPAADDTPASAAAEAVHGKVLAMARAERDTDTEVVVGRGYAFQDARWVPFARCDQPSSSCPEDTAGRDEADDDETLPSWDCTSSRLCDFGVARVAEGRVTAVETAFSMEIGLQTPLSETIAGWGFAAADVDGDGAPELVAQSSLEGTVYPGIGALTETYLTVYTGDGHVMWSERIAASGEGPHETCAGIIRFVDQNCDGHRDIVLTLTCESTSCAGLAPDDEEQPTSEGCAYPKEGPITRTFVFEPLTRAFRETR